MSSTSAELRPRLGDLAGGAAALLPEHHIAEGTVVGVIDIAAEDYLVVVKWRGVIQNDIRTWYELFKSVALVTGLLVVQPGPGGEMRLCIEDVHARTLVLRDRSCSPLERGAAIARAGDDMAACVAEIERLRRALARWEALVTPGTIQPAT